MKHKEFIGTYVQSKNEYIGRVLNSSYKGSFTFANLDSYEESFKQYVEDCYELLLDGSTNIELELEQPVYEQLQELALLQNKEVEEIILEALADIAAPEVTYIWSRMDPNGYECSSIYDRRFSAFYARLEDGRTIEQHYQCDIKGYDVGGTNWKAGKGNPPLVDISYDEQWKQYKQLWVKYFELNPELLMAIRMSGRTTMTDSFATSDINQARAIAEILNERQQLRSDFINTL